MGALPKSREKDSAVGKIPTRSDGHLQAFEYEELSCGMGEKRTGMLAEIKYRKSQGIAI
jgi:hypothetical protein